MPNEKSQKPELATPFWVMGLALILALFCARWIASTAPDFENLALGEQTFPVYGTYQGDEIFCAAIDEIRGGYFDDASQCLVPAHKRDLKQRVVWLGNSQLHAINQPKQGDKTAPTLLAETLRPKGVEMLGFSFPSASLTEMMVMTHYLRSDHPISVLVVPLFLDDTREQSVRETLRPGVERPDLKVSLLETATGRYAVAAMAKTAGSADAPAEASGQSLQQRSENIITGWLERCCGLQTTRSKARGQIEIQAFLFRNFAFNITAQSVRPIIPMTYQQNMTALDDILREAKAHGTKVIAYIPPLRQDFKPPYDPQQYADFKRETKALVSRYGARWIDVDGLVPGRYWGTKAATRTGGDPELDFMHYQEPGHVLLARAMLPEVESALK